MKTILYGAREICLYRTFLFCLFFQHMFFVSWLQMNLSASFFLFTVQLRHLGSGIFFGPLGRNDHLVVSAVLYSSLVLLWGGCLFETWKKRFSTDSASCGNSMDVAGIPCAKSCWSCCIANFKVVSHSSASTAIIHEIFDGWCSPGVNCTCCGLLDILLDVRLVDADSRCEQSAEGLFGEAVGMFLLCQPSSASRNSSHPYLWSCLGFWCLERMVWWRGRRWTSGQVWPGSAHNPAAKNSSKPWCEYEALHTSVHFTFDHVWCFLAFVVWQCGVDPKSLGLPSGSADHENLEFGRGDFKVLWHLRDRSAGGLSDRAANRLQTRRSFDDENITAHRCHVSQSRFGSSDCFESLGCELTAHADGTIWIIGLLASLGSDVVVLMVVSCEMCRLKTLPWRSKKKQQADSLGSGFLVDSFLSQ